MTTTSFEQIEWTKDRIIYLIEYVASNNSWFEDEIDRIANALGLAYSDGREGGELLQPLALTSIGGLAYATILTLYVVPAMYESFTKRQNG